MTRRSVARAPTRLVTAVGVFVLATLLSPPASAAKSAGNERTACRQTVRAMADDLKAVLAARNRLRDALEDTICAEDPATAPTALYLRLEGALDGSPLLVELCHDGRSWQRGRAQAPRWNAAVHRADADGLALADGKLTGTLRVTLAWDRRLPHDGKPIVCVYAVDATLSDGRVAGRAETKGAPGEPPVPPWQGDLAGETVSWSPPPPPKPPEWPLVGDDAAGLYAEARWIERTAMAAYRHVRAMDVARHHRLPFDVALRGMTDLVPARWPLDRFKAAKQGKDVPVPLLEEVNLGLEDTLDDSEPDIDFAMLLETLRSMQSRIARTRSLVETVALDPGAPTDFVIGSIPTGDPDFGPWYGDEPLPRAGDKPNIVPADAGADGPPDWRYLAGWRVVGPFPAADRSLRTPRLPELVEAADAALQADPRVLGEQSPVEKELAWRTAAVEPATGRLYPPIWHYEKYPKDVAHAGMPRGHFYAVADVHAERDADLWLGVGVNDGGNLWINDRLVWVAPPDRHPRSEEETFVFKAHFRRGPNHLLFRCDNDNGNTFFRIRVCLAGKPRDPRDAHAHAEAVEKARAALEDPLDRITGWRGNWTGCYPDATPVTAWDIEKGINVLWRTPMPWCNATPVLVGDKVFTQLEPHTLVCVDKADGAVLWRRDSNVLELIDKGLLAESERLWAEVENARDAIAGLEGDMEQQIAALEAQGMSAEEAQRRYHELRAKARPGGFWRFFQKHAGVSAAGWGDFYGHSFPTPVTNGRHVWVKYGTGVAACYDLDGNRQWMVRTGSTSKDVDVCPSPLLAVGKLVLELPASAVSPKAEKGHAVLRALDPRTGETLWTSKPYPHAMMSATPVPLRLTNARHTMDVVATGGGAVIRLDDGHILCHNLGAHAGNGTPVLVGDVLHYSAPAVKTAVRLLMVDRDRIGCHMLWSRWIGCEFSAGMVHHNGILYGLSGGQIAGPVLGLDADSGDVVRVQGAVMPDPGRAYMPPALAGGLLFTADDGRLFARHRSRPGTMSVLEPGPDGTVLARNYMEGLHAAPVFEADRMVVRTRQSLMCIGPTGDPGRAYEAVVNVKTVLEAIFPDRPVPGPAVAIKAARPLRPPHRWRYTHREAPRDWRIAGPFPLPSADEALASLGGPDAARADGEKPAVRVNGRPDPFAPLPAEHLLDGWLHAQRVDLRAAVAGRPVSVAYYLATYLVDRPRTLRFAMRTPGARAWLDGVPIRHNQRARLGDGSYSLLVEVRIGNDMPEALTLVPRFYPSDDAHSELEAWTRAVRKRRHLFDRAARLAPETEAGRLAADLIRELDTAD